MISSMKGLKLKHSMIKNVEVREFRKWKLGLG